MLGSSQRRFFAGLCLLLVWQSGCAAFRPMHGVPARYLPEEMKYGDRSSRRTIDLSLLRQPQPPAHLIDSGDVLGIYVEGFVGRASDPPPVHFPLNNDSPPSFGHPSPVREDGTISLPVVGSLNVRGLTLVQAEERVKQAYLTPRQLIRPDFHRVQVNLQRPRQYRVLVIRQDSRNEPQATESFGQLNIGFVKRGTGKVVNLPVYSNDVLNALTATDGLPGLDAENAVYVIRRRGNSPGGTLDPRWPTDLNPSLLQGAVPSPVIRSQSPDHDGGYLHSQPWPQPMQPRGTSPGLPAQQVQFAGANAAAGASGGPVALQASAGATPQDHRGTNHDYGLAPPRVWQDRPSVAPIAYEPLAPTSASPGPGPGHFAAQPPAGPSPAQGLPAQSRWNGPPTDPRLMQGDPNASSHSPYQHDPTQVQPQSQPYPPPAPALPTEVPYPGGPPGVPQPWNDGIPPLNAAPYGNPSIHNGRILEPGHGLQDGGTMDGRHVIRIPIRLGPGETADIRPEDVVLYDGDIVFIESRDTEVFYTGGLLGGGQYTLPRDYDLDVLQALSLAQSRSTGGGSRSIGGVSALNNDVSISPSTAIILRKLPDGGEIPVKVDLYRARTDLSERIVIQPGDYILLQYTPLEAIGAFFERHLLETALFAVATQQLNGNGN